jgi:hypothetical protein
LGGVQAKVDEWLFIFRSSVGTVYMFTHVDDFAVIYTDPVLYGVILSRMREVFIGGFKDLGPLHKFLGIIIWVSSSSAARRAGSGSTRHPRFWSDWA